MATEGGKSGATKVLMKKRHSLRAQRLLKKKEPQVVEGPKCAMLLRGHKTNPNVTQLLNDFRQLKVPNALPYSRRNEVRPFEDPSSIEFFSTKNECFLFCVGSNTKKRPNNIIFGRLFDYQLLDMVEIGFSNLRSLQSSTGKKPAIGSAPCMIFKGDKFELREDHKALKSILLDFFRGQEREMVDLASLDHVIFVTASPTTDTIHFRHYSIKLKKSGTKLPRVELDDIGPSFDFTIRRAKYAAPDMAKQALQQPKELNPSKVKNMRSNMFGQKIGTVHMHRQDFQKLQVKKTKALKRTRTEESEGAQSSAVSQPQPEKKRKINKD
jgi:ribosome production factor 2